MTELYLVVVFIDDAVRTSIGSCFLVILSTYIFIYKHTWTNLIFGHTHVRSDVVLVEILLDILKAAEHTDALHTPETDVGTMTVSHLTIDVLGFPVHVKDLVVRVAGVDTYMVLDVLADTVAPPQESILPKLVEALCVPTVAGTSCARFINISRFHSR